MKQLSKKERHEIYKGVIGIAEHENRLVHPDFCESGLCYELLEFEGINGVNSDYALDIFPEFALFKPFEWQKEGRYIWWDSGDDDLDQMARLICVMFCVEMTK